MLDLSAINAQIGIEEEPDGTIIDQVRAEEDDEAYNMLPWQMTDLEIWFNYCDDDIYFLDKEVRKYLKLSRWTRERHKKRLRTTVPLVFQHIFNRAPVSGDGQTCRILHMLMKYYCTRYTGSTLYRGKRVASTYYFSPYAARSRRPYSLRLRLEEKNDVYSFRPYGINTDKRTKPGPGDYRYGNPNNGLSRKISGGDDAQDRLSARTDECEETSGSADVHGCDLQSGHQDDNPDHIES